MQIEKTIIHQVHYIFYGYFHMCNKFQHRAIECKLYPKKSTRVHTPFFPYLGQITCYLFSNLGKKVNDCRLPYILKYFKEKMKATSNNQNYELERKKHKIRKITKSWKRNENEHHMNFMTKRKMGKKRKKGGRGSTMLLSGLNIINILKVASSALSMGTHHDMQISENLYTQCHKFSHIFFLVVSISLWF